MGSKADMLAAIRRQKVPPTQLPSLDQAWIRYDDPFAQFKSLVESVGGRCYAVSDAPQANRTLQENSAFTQARQTVSLVPGIGSGNIELDAVDDPHRLETIDFAIVPGHFAVAENGAIWVTDEQIKHRAILFICQHLVLVVPKLEILNNMHEAYARMAFSGAGFGVFISGPSKTADIEQSLVIGAHGARSLTVFFVE